MPPFTRDEADTLAELLADDTDRRRAIADALSLPESPRDRNGKVIKVGDSVRWYGRPRENNEPSSYGIVKQLRPREVNNVRAEFILVDGSKFTTVYPSDFLALELPPAKDRNGRELRNGDTVRFQQKDADKPSRYHGTVIDATPTAPSGKHRPTPQVKVEWHFGNGMLRDDVQDTSAEWLVYDAYPPLTDAEKVKVLTEALEKLARYGAPAAQRALDRCSK